MIFTRSNAEEMAKGGKTIEIPQGYTTIDDYAFGASKPLPANHPFAYITTVILPNGLIKIGRHAFSWCRSLEEIVIPHGVKEIGAHAFFNCGQLASVIIADSVTLIGRDAFRFCTSLTKITIPSGVRTIFGGTFVGCANLTAVIMPDSVIAINKDAFYSKYEHHNKNKKPITIYSSRKAYAKKYCGWGIFSKVKWKEADTATFVEPKFVTETIQIIEEETSGGDDARFVKFIDELSTTQKQINENDMNGQINKLSGAVKQILSFAEEKPHCWRLIDKKFADYYFPTALKLIDTYIESLPMQAESNEIKKIIEGIAPAIRGITTALENQLNTLYKAMSVDVAADIDVLNHMLMIDGVDIEKKEEKG